MSLFVSPENQKLLWSVINKNPLINNYFMTNSIKKDVWFKTAIHIFYEQNKTRILNQNDLLVLNKTVISYMIKSIKDNHSQTSSQEQFVQPETMSGLKSYSITENKIEKIGSNQFEKKQAEYNSFFDKKVPETPDFGEKQDKPLSNMDELIKHHLKEREDELRKYAPPPLTNQNAAVAPKLKIDSNTESDTINISIEELHDTDGENKSKKSVSWHDDVNSEKINKQQEEIDLLKTQIIALFERINILEEK